MTRRAPAGIVGLWGPGPWQGTGISTGSSRRRDFEPLHPGVSLPPPCWADAEGSSAAQHHSNVALPHMGHPGAGRRGHLPSMPGICGHPAYRTHPSLPTCPMQTPYTLLSSIAQPGHAHLASLLLGTCLIPVAATSSRSRSHCPASRGSDGQAAVLMLESKAPCITSSLLCAHQLAQVCSSQQSVAVGSKACKEPQSCLLHLAEEHHLPWSFEGGCWVPAVPP